MAPPRRQRVLVVLMLVAGVLGATAATAISTAVTAGARPERESEAPPPAKAARRAPIKGQGSTYVGLAMNQWKAAGQNFGLDINYLPNGSPAGLGAYNVGSVDFAGTEAEFSSLLAGSGNTDVRRGYQYVPDVGGAVAIMYNLRDRSGRTVNYLHLSRRTIAKIFTGAITSWSDPQISAENKGFKFPDKPITVVYRGGQSGTTALFYDFIANTDPAGFGAWARRLGLSTEQRIIQLDNTGNPFPSSLSFNSSDQIAQYVANTDWTIGYDEFGYAKTYRTNVAWVDNAAGRWTQPYAVNIAAALTGARLRPDLSQELSGVYVNRDPSTYPISAYSYLVTQCARTGDRPTCRGPYSNAGITQTLKEWMGYIACDGQVSMARIGYSPLPQNLSQEIMNSVARMTGNPSDRKALNAGNCNNPRFRGNLGVGSANPNCDPYVCGSIQQAPTNTGGTGAIAGDPTASGGTGPGGLRAGGTGTGGGASGSGSTGGAAADGASDEQAAAANQQEAAGRAREAGAGRTGRAASVGGGSAISRRSDPRPYRGEKSPDLGAWPLIILVVVLVTPIVASIVVRRRRAGSF